MKKSTKIVLNKAKIEIIQLRKKDENQSIRLRMFDDMMAVFYGGSRQQGMQYSPDVLSEIEEELTREDEEDELKEDEEA
jgi:hypothetical protein